MLTAVYQLKSFSLLHQIILYFSEVISGWPFLRCDIWHTRLHFVRTTCISRWRCKSQLAFHVTRPNFCLVICGATIFVQPNFRYIFQPIMNNCHDSFQSYIIITFHKGTLFTQFKLCLGLVIRFLLWDHRNLFSLRSSDCVCRWNIKKLIHSPYYCSHFCCWLFSGLGYIESSISQEIILIILKRSIRSYVYCIYIHTHTHT